MNHIMLTGTIQAGYQDKPAIETTTTQGGHTIAKFRLLVLNGEKGKDFFTVKAWNKQAERVGVELAVGARVAVQGRHTNDRYKDSQEQWHDAWTVHISDFEVLGGAVAAPAPVRATAPVAQEEIPF